MLSHIFFDQNRIYIRITVFTQMSASIIGAYICPQKTCAFPISLIFLSLWNFQSAMESCLKCMKGCILSLFTPFTATLYHKSTVLSGLLRYLHSYKQTYSLFLQVHMLHPGSGTHKMHVEMCLSSARTDIL